ncbi:hypothetical protein B0H17DRAFT_403222 [Mycena rosella]|uniref:Uncharacterized protein n=1 Tax=Mycena rosella TaxID=1033263 RepID=A0AAD7GIK7_MYCRO|nr:hypothetical protein B0H17DRAFT_403222 [Mycena rosella]
MPALSHLSSLPDMPNRHIGILIHLPCRICQSAYLNPRCGNVVWHGPSAMIYASGSGGHSRIPGAHWRSLFQLFYLNCRTYTNLRYNFAASWICSARSGMVICISHPYRPIGRDPFITSFSFPPLHSCVVFSVSSICPSRELCSWERCSGFGVSRASSSSPKSRECLVYEIDLAIQSENIWASLAQLPCCRLSAPVYWIGPAGFLLAGSVVLFQTDNSPNFLAYSSDSL